MRISFIGYVKETEDCKGIWMNSFDICLADGRMVTIDRDTTEYLIEEDGTMTMEWIGVYIWDGYTADYNLNAEMFDGCLLSYVDVEDDADADYELRIDWFDCYD